MKRLAIVIVLLAARFAGAQGTAIGCSNAGPTGNDAFNVTLTSGTTITIGPNCSATNVAIARFGVTIYRFTSSATATLTSGTGTAYVYVLPNGALSVGQTGGLAFTCSGCTKVDGISSFPANSLPIWTWTATAGAWDSSGGTDQRATQEHPGATTNLTDFSSTAQKVNGQVPMWNAQQGQYVPTLIVVPPALSPAVANNPLLRAAALKHFCSQNLSSICAPVAVSRPLNQITGK